MTRRLFGKTTLVAPKPRQMLTRRRVVVLPELSVSPPHPLSSKTPNQGLEALNVCLRLSNSSRGPLAD